MTTDRPADLLREAHEAVDAIFDEAKALGGSRHTLGRPATHAAIDRAVEGSKTQGYSAALTWLRTEGAGEDLSMRESLEAMIGAHEREALSKRDAEWREAAYAECFTPGHPTCAKFKDQHSVHKYGCGACRTVARMGLTAMEGK